MPNRELLKALTSAVRYYSIAVTRDIVMAIYKSWVADQKQWRVRSVAQSEVTRAHIASPEVVVDQNNRRIVMFFHGQQDSMTQSTHIGTSANGLDFKVSPEVILGAYLRSFR